MTHEVFNRVIPAFNTSHRLALRDALREAFRVFLLGSMTLILVLYHNGKANLNVGRLTLAA